MMEDRFLNTNWKTALLLFLLWFGILTVTGSLFSGYHLVDDHEVVNKALADPNDTRGIKLSPGAIIEGNRFRPVYYLHRIAQAELFGADFLLWSIYTGLLAVLTSFFLFVFMRKTGFSSMESLLFALLTLLGEQAATWWKLGANETFGMLVLSITLVFMAQSVYSQNKRILYEILFIIFTIITSLAKESFILLIPALVCWKIWLTYEKNKSTRIAAGKNWFTASILAAVFGVELLYIVKVVGTTGISYAGYEGFNMAGFFETGLRLSIYAHAWILLIQLLSLVLYYKYTNSSGKNKEIKELLPPVVLFGLVVLPQVILYMKSGIGERYLLPGVMGYYFLMIYFYRHIRLRIPPGFSCETGKCWPGLAAAFVAAVSLSLLILDIVISIEWPFEILRYRGAILAAAAVLFLGVLVTLTFISKFKKFFYAAVFNYKRILVLLLAALLLNLVFTAANAAHFAVEGRNINKWFQSIEQHSHETDHILIITDDVRYFEWSYALKTYLNLKMKRKNLYSSPVTGVLGPVKGRFWEILNRDFLSRFPTFRLTDSRHRALFKTVLIFPGLEKEFLKHSSNWFQPDRFERYVNPAGFVSYYHRHKK